MIITVVVIIIIIIMIKIIIIMDEYSSLMSAILFQVYQLSLTSKENQ